MIKQDPHEKNDDMTDTSGNDQTANNKGNAGSKRGKGNKPGERYTQREAYGTQVSPEAGDISSYYPGDGMHAQKERYYDTNNVQATVRTG
jgi:hypothetical protein